jgi:hypothetical protein
MTDGKPKGALAILVWVSITAGLGVGYVAGRASKSTPIAQAAPPEDLEEVMALRNENAIMRGKVMASNEERFERNNSLHSTFENCKDGDDGKSRCSAFTESGAPVAYHCDIEGCVLDCGGPR